MARILLAVLAVLILPGSLLAATETLNLDRQYPVLEAENNVWIGTPAGLLRFSPEDETFKRFTLPAGTETPGIKELRYSDEWLWCILDRGLAALHIRLNEWLFFDQAAGLPSDKVSGLDFHEDYVWVGTAGGAARFDLLIEEWEIYDETLGAPEGPVNDVVVGDDRIWVITDHTFSEYDTEFERWRHYAPTRDESTLLRAFLVGDELWLVTDQGLIRFNTELQTQQVFSQMYLLPDHLLELVVENSTIWALTRLGLYHYDQASGVWREFEGNSYLKAAALVGGYIDQAAVWVLTDRNILVWDRDERSWEILDYASGLSASTFESAHVNGGMAFLLRTGAIDYRLSAESSWRKYEVKTGAVGDIPSGRHMLKTLFDNEEGGHIEAGKYRLGFEGTRATLIQDYENRTDIEEDSDIVSSERLDIKSQLSLGESRTVLGFYNNIDYSEIMYGVRYRSRGDDIIREVNWGDYRHEPGSVPFGVPASMFGSNVWLQAGPKTPRFKRSLVTLKARTGERRSLKAYETFRGVSRQSNVTVLDTDYARSQFYSIPGLPSGDIPAAIEIYVDNLVALDNTPNTLERQTIAGTTGDWDLKKEGEDYCIYDRAGLIRFTSFISAGWKIVVRYTYQGMTHEEVLQLGYAASTAQTNFYNLGAPGIIPYTFDLAILDTLGTEVPLSQFGLDTDGDGAVDSEWIDYAEGILLFPDAQPFPPEVYDPNTPRSVYRMEVSFETELSIIQLAQTDLVRGTEILTLDGLTAEGGNDYVLDYTNGTLVFVREGLVSDDTRIEIEYEHYVDEETDHAHGAMLDYSPSDALHLQGDWVRMEGDDEMSDLFSVHGEARQTVGGYDFRIIPGLALQSVTGRVAGSGLQGFVSSSRLRVQTDYETYAESYKNLYRPQYILGDVKSRLRFHTVADATDDVRLTGEWQEVKGFARDGETSPRDRTESVTLLLHRPNLPGWEVTYRRFTTEQDAETAERYFVQNRLEYQLPQRLSRKLHIESLKAEAYLRKGRRSGTSTAGSDRQRFRQGHVQITSGLTDRFQGSFFYRRNDTYDASAGDGKEPMTQAERLLFNLSHEQWRLVQMNLRVENTLDHGFHRNSELKDVALDRRSQVNVRLAPGWFWEVLTPVHFEYNVSRSYRASGVTGGTTGDWIWSATASGETELEDSQVLTQHYFRNEFRPSPYWYVYSLIEWNSDETQCGPSTLESHDWLWSEKADIKLGLNTRLTLQYNQFSKDSGYDRTLEYFEPSIWVERRWTPDLQNVMRLAYRRSRSDEGKIRDTSDNWDAGYDLIWRKGRYLGMKRLEVTQGLTGSHVRTKGYNPADTYLIGYTSSLDLYPLHSLIVRLQVNLNRYLDRLDPEHDYDGIAINLKTSLRF
jgi:hypothetical protein